MLFRSAMGMHCGATRLDLHNPWVDWTMASLQASAGQPATLLPNLAGSLPNDIFADQLGLPTLWVPHSYPACAQHAPNEHLLAPVAREGLAVMAGLFWDLGEPQGTPWTEGRTARQEATASLPGTCCFIGVKRLFRDDERHTNHAGADVGADSRPNLADAPAGQVQVLVQIVVHRGGKLLIVAVQQRVAVGRPVRPRTERDHEAGIVLEGWEVKAIRAGRANIKESYVVIRDGEVFIFGMHITPLAEASTHVHPDPTRTRKLLLHAKQISKLIGLVERAGYTLMPLDLHYQKGRIKVEIGLAKGKKQHDKRESEKERDWNREKQRLMRVKIGE